MGDAAALGPAGAGAAANTLGTESHFPMERTNRPGVPRHRVLAAHSPHSPGSPRAPAAEMDLLPAALRATALPPAAALGLPGEWCQGLSKGITWKGSTQTSAP